MPKPTKSAELRFTMDKDGEIQVYFSGVGEDIQMMLVAALGSKVDEEENSKVNVLKHILRKALIITS